MKRAVLLLLAPLALSSTPLRAAEPAMAAKLEALVQRGGGEAAYHLGMLYHLGLGGAAKDPRKALELFRLAAERGDPLGAYKLGCYYDGQGEGLVEADAPLALKHKLVAAEAGYALAQRDVAGHLLRAGDTAGGLRWLEAAAGQGDGEALSLLAGFYSGVVPQFAGQRDAAKAIAFLLIGLRQMMPEEGAAAAQEVLAEPPFSASAEEAKRGVALANGWKPSPTPVTLLAGQGLAAAERLLAAATPQAPDPAVEMP